MMPKARITLAAKQVLATKLKQARSLRQLSTRNVSELLPVNVRVSHTTIASYERGASVPSTTLLACLSSIYDKPLNWFHEDGPVLQGVRYRNLKSKVRSADRQLYEADAHRWLDAYLRLEVALNQPLSRHATALVEKAPQTTDVDEMVEFVRKRLHLSLRDPLPSMNYALRHFGIRCIEVPTDYDIDGFAGRLGDEHVVVLNTSVPNDRARMNGLHELMHILFGDCDTDLEWTDHQHRKAEQRAFQAASKVLMHSEVLKRAFDGRSMVRLIQFKESYGISLSAMIYRAEEEKIIPKSLAKRLWIEFSKRGWRKQEPGKVRPDRATRFEQLIDGAIVTGKKDWQDISEITRLNIRDLQSRVRAIGEGISDDSGETTRNEGGDDKQNGLRLVR